MNKVIIEDTNWLESQIINIGHGEISITYVIHNNVIKRKIRSVSESSLNQISDNNGGLK